MKPNDKTDCETIELPDVVFVEGKVYLRERGT